MKVIYSLFFSFALLFASIDINTASEKDLTSLNGIGSSKAKAIVEYRVGNCFKTVEELAKVKGIGKKTVDRNIDNLTVSKCK